MLVSVSGSTCDLSDLKIDFSGGKIFINRPNQAKFKICLFKYGKSILKKKYPKSFIAKLSDSEGETAETQVWLDFSLAFNYIDNEKHVLLYDKYGHILSQLVIMINSPEKWCH